MSARTLSHPGSLSHCSDRAAAVNGEAAGLLTGAIGGGLALAVMIYATVGDNCSKGRLNPAVSLGYLVTGRAEKNEVILEIIAQFLGGFVGGILLKMSLPHTDLTVPLLAMGGPSTAHPLSVFIWEFLATAFLVYTVFAVVEDKQSRPQPKDDQKCTLPGEFGPLVIGLVVVVCSLAAGPFSGAAMNPARALGPALVFWNFRNIWVYLFATFFGGVAGAVVYENAFLEHQPPGTEEEEGKL